MRTFYLFVFLLVISIGTSYAQNPGCAFGARQLQTGISNNGPFNPIFDLLHVRHFTTPGVISPCTFNNSSALRLDFDEISSFGQLSIVGTGGINSNLSTPGDVVLRASCTAEDIILTTQSTGGAIRFATTTGPALGICANNYPNTDIGPPPLGMEKERMTILSSGFVGIHNTNPLREVQFGELLNFNEGDWSSMLYNSWLDRTNPIWQKWKTKRIVAGTSGGFGFVPNRTPANNEVARQRQGGASMNAQKWGAINTEFVKVDDAGNVIIDTDPITVDHPFHLPVPDYGNNLWLSYDALELWSGTQGVQFRVTNDIPRTTANGIDATTFPSGIPGWAYFKNKVLIGTEGTTITDPNGNSGGGNIDVTNPNCTDCNVTQPLMLAVNGLVLCKELLVKTSTHPWPDYVFAPEYKLLPLADLEKSILENKKLPDIPSAKDIEAGGVNVVTLEAKLLEKVEELTLYVIQLNKENQQLKEMVTKATTR